MKANELFISNDGSHSLLSSKFQVPYHSVNGAIAETQHVFIDAGMLEKAHLSQISILEIGFGTGLNALVSIINAKSSITYYYETIEAFPIDSETAKSLNYPSELNVAPLMFLNLHDLDWDAKHQIQDNFTFKKNLNKFEDFETENTFDVIYYDAFAPSSQPDLWEAPILEKMYSLLNPDGVLVTYCAQGQFKRNLKAVGFSIETLPGPVGKREMTRARK